MGTAYGELADELGRLAEAVRSGSLAPAPRPSLERTPEPPAPTAEATPRSVAGAFLESLGGITAYVLIVSGILVLGFNVAIRLFPPAR